MPIYEYQCQTCGETIDVLQSMSAAGPAGCEKCGGRLRRRVSAPCLNFGKHTSRTAERHTRLSTDQQARRERDRLLEHSKKTGIPFNELFEDHHGD